MALPRRIEIAQIVVCEDDRPTLELLCEHLAADRFGALAAPGAADALRLCQFKRPDLLLLDLNLPDASGFDLLRELRDPDRARSRFDPKLGVIVLSGRSSENDRVRALEEGADDFVLKPFSYLELRARINAVLRRRQVGTAQPTHVGELTIDHRERTVSVGGRTVALSAKEFALLAALATDPGRVFTKEELLRDVWGYRSMGHTRTLETHVSRLRHKLDPEQSRFIVNCWGVGYRLLDR